MGPMPRLRTDHNVLKNKNFFSSMMMGVGALALIVPSLGAAAQNASDNGQAPEVGLNVPRNLTIFSDPNAPKNVYKPTAIVNGEIITATDVEQRLALIRIANGGKISDEEAQRLRMQIFSNLVDEKLQIQAAKANEIEVKEEEVNGQFARIAANFKQTPDAFTAYLAKNGSSATSMKQQIRGEMAWDRLLGRNVEPFANVSSEEVQSIVDRMKAQQGTEEFWLGEIFLSGTPETMEATAANAQKIMEQLRQGGSFQAYARQFSEASTAVVGGDLGWVRQGQIPEEMAQAALTMQPGQVGIVQVPGGLSILALREKRKMLVASAADAVLSLKQISLPFAKGTSAEKASQLASTFASQTKAIAGCGQADEVAAKLGASIVSRDNIAMRDLPAPLQNTLSTLQIGQTTQPFGSAEEGVSVLVLCGRDMPTDAGVPSAEQVESQIRQDKVNKRAQRYLRDLRRDAVIEYS